MQRWKALKPVALLCFCEFHSKIIMNWCSYLYLWTFSLTFFCSITQAWKLWFVRHIFFYWWYFSDISRPMKRAVVVGYLKLTPAIFYIFFSPNDSPSKTMKNKFTSSKKIFQFSRYSNFCNFFPFFQHFPDSKWQMEVE